MLWYPTSGENAQYGFLPSEVGSLWVTFVALLMCVPLGVMAAIFISEFASARFKEISKSVVEFMAAIPSVVLGLIGLALLVPWVKETFNVDTGLTAFAAGIMVGVLALPTIVSISEDALHAVPAELRFGSAALGNTSGRRRTRSWYRRPHRASSLRSCSVSAERSARRWSC